MLQPEIWAWASEMFTSIEESIDEYIEPQSQKGLAITVAIESQVS